jgi:nucleoside-diphosphate-sugar epimerase
LIADGHHVSALVRQSSSIPSLRQKGVTATVGDVRNPESLTPALAGADVVFNLARARAHGSIPREAFEVNAGGSRNVARAAMESGVARVVHASSSAVYGSRVGLVNESAVLHPDSAYARSKADAETAMNDECGDRVVIARITAVMGNGARTWKPLVSSAAAGKLRLVGDGLNMHHPADISDIIEGLMRCAFTPGVGGGTYNLAGPEPVSIHELRAHLASAATGGRTVRFSRPYPRLPVSAYYRLGVLTDRAVGFRPPLFESVMFITADRVLDLTRSRSELGFVPTIGIAEAAARTVNWLRRERGVTI